MTQIVALASLWGIYGEEPGRGRGLARGGEDEGGGELCRVEQIEGGKHS